MLLHKFEYTLLHRRRIRLKELDIFEPKFNQLLDKAIKHNNEKIAFLCWQYLQIIEIIRKYYKTYELLKSRQYFNAWCELERIELLFLDLKRNAVDYSNYKIIAYIYEYFNKFQKLFPYVLFISPEYYVKKKRCSICNQIVNPLTGCKHIPGRVYLGKICSTIIEEMELISTAVVEKPQQKYSALFENIEKPERYAVLEYFIPKLKTSFDNWNYSIYTEYIEDPTYSIYDNQRCPCGSKLLYQNCCKKKLPAKTRPHYEFTFL